VWLELRGQSVHDLHRLQADADDLTYETDDVLGIVFTIRVRRDSAALVRRDLVLVDDPFQGATVAEAV
jgi:hypothetical protein